MNETIVTNLEVNINRLIEAINSLPKLEAEQGVVDAIKNIPEVDFTDVKKSLDDVCQCISDIKFPEVNFEKEKDAIVNSLDSVKSAINAKNLQVNIDLAKVEELLQNLCNMPMPEMPEMKHPDNFPLPDDQLKKLTPDFSAIEEGLKKVEEAIGNIRISGGGGGADVVGLKKTLPSGEQIQINPATEEAQLSMAGLVTKPYDTVEVNYTDSTKEVISTIVYKKDAAIVATITATQPTSTKEIYTNL